jgi:hypothetical protein
VDARPFRSFAGPGDVEALVRFRVEFLLQPVPAGELVSETWEKRQALP